MIKRKRQNQQGKIKLSRYFQDFKKGDRVAIIRELGVQPTPLKKLQGRSGIVEVKRGHSYLVKINDFNKPKTHIVHPVHLRKLKS